MKPLAKIEYFDRSDWPLVKSHRAKRFGQLSPAEKADSASKLVTAIKQIGS